MPRIKHCDNRRLAKKEPGCKSTMDDLAISALPIHIFLKICSFVFCKTVYCSSCLKGFHVIELSLKILIQWETCYPLIKDVFENRKQYSSQDHLLLRLKLCTFM